MLIRKNNNTQTTTNFKEYEFFSKSFNSPDHHFVDDLLIGAIQHIRTHFGVPIEITSSFRTLLHNTAIGSSTTSQHLFGLALDFKFLQNNKTLIKEFNEDILSQGVLFQELRSYGINAFGIYDTFIHIDVRLNEEEFGFEYENESTYGGSFAYWDLTKKKVYESPLTLLKAFFSEDGFKGTKSAIYTMLIVFLFPYMSYRILKK
tara:strand:- start:5615 stop:6226 length:612 start_codon:yes stop_codon:yes gene_type:complete